MNEAKDTPTVEQITHVLNTLEAERWQKRLARPRNSSGSTVAFCVGLAVLSLAITWRLLS